MQYGSYYMTLRTGIILIPSAELSVLRLFHQLEIFPVIASALVFIAGGSGDEDEKNKFRQFQTGSVYLFK